MSKALPGNRTPQQGYYSLVWLPGWLPNSGVKTGAFPAVLQDGGKVRRASRGCAPHPADHSAADAIREAAPRHDMTGNACRCLRCGRKLDCVRWGSGLSTHRIRLGSHNEMMGKATRIQSLTT